MNRDNLHFNFRTIDGYNLPFNFVISEREAGKSTAVWLDKAFKVFKETFRPSLVIRRLINDITDTYIHDIGEVINKFADEPVELIYKSKGMKEGIVDVYIKDHLFLRVIALSNPMSRIKSLIVRNLSYIIFDEFICNQRMGEKYLKDEAFKFFEVYNTFQREADNLKCYFLGNPYSLYNPYFVWLDVDTKALKRGTIYKGLNFVIQAYEITKELREHILAKNPLYQFDNSYTKYAFGGEAINDANIKLGELPPNYHLQFIFRAANKYIGVYQNNYLDDHADKYFCTFIDEVGSRRDVIAFDFAELIDKTCLLAQDDRWKFNRFKIAMRNRNISFKNIECYYLIEEIYYNL